MRKQLCCIQLDAQGMCLHVMDADERHTPGN
jgi:hypothetical protein